MSARPRRVRDAVGAPAASPAPGSERVGPASREEAPLVRPARLADVGPMARMINGYAAQGLMLPRTPVELYRAFREYLVVAEPDGGVAACGGLRIYGPHLAEIVGLAVRDDRRGGGYGGRLVEGLVREARTLEIEAVFAMTLEVEFFGRHGFRPMPREHLPEKVAVDCRGCARREGCRETAVLRRMHRERRPRRRLRVLSP